MIILALLASFILGMAKAGLKGMGIVIVTLMAIVYDARMSTGILLPMLVVADIIAVIYYNRHTQRKYLFKFLPWMIIGVLLGVVVGKYMPDELFRNSMAVIILISVVLMFYNEKIHRSGIAQKTWFAAFMGIAAGFTTMVGNLAGAFANIFFLSTRIPKNEFIGTAAWLFFIVNVFKVPFHVFYWGTINIDTLKINLQLLPMIFIGFFAGVKLVSKIKDAHYRIFILVMTALGALVLLIR